MRRSKQRSAAVSGQPSGGDVIDLLAELDEPAETPSAEADQDPSPPTDG